MIALVFTLALGAAPAYGQACTDDCLRRLHPCHRRVAHAPPCTEPPLPLRCDAASTSPWCQAAREIKKCDDACDAAARARAVQERTNRDNREIDARRSLTASLDEARCEVDPVCRGERLRREEEQRERDREEADRRQREWEDERRRQQEEADRREEDRQEREANEARAEREYQDQQRAESDRQSQESWNRTADSIRQSNDAWRNQMNQINQNVVDAQRRDAERRADEQRRADANRDRQRTADDARRRADDARERDRERVQQQQEQQRQREVAQREQADRDRQRQREEQQRRDDEKQKEQERLRQEAAEQKRLNACNPANQCLGVGKVLPGAGYCSTTSGRKRKDYLPVFKNACNTGIDCRICGRGADTHCVEWYFPAGDSLGGWASEFTWCDIDQVAWRCAAQVEKHSAAHCVKDFQ